MCSTALRGLSSVASSLVRRQSAWPLHLHVRNVITLRRDFCARANAAHALDDASSEKLGSASPWATDGWGDSVEIIEQTMPDAHRALLSNASVAIPTSSAEAGELPADELPVRAVDGGPGGPESLEMSRAVPRRLLQTKPRRLLGSLGESG